MLDSTRSSLSVLVVAVGLMLALPPVVSAQVCFRGHPRGRCAGFAVLELTTAALLNPQSNGLISGTDKGSFYIAWQAGYLQNVGGRSALGAAFKLAADDDSARYGPVLRYRQWLGPTWSIDLAPGVLLGGHDNRLVTRYPSATADLAINWGDRVAFTVGADQLRLGSGSRWESRAGLRFGTWWAPLAMAGLVALAAATYNN
jgi:hypothetical protein